MYEELINNLRERSQWNPITEAKLMIEAADAIEELQKPKWISVAERLPEEKCKCLVYKKHTGLSALVSFTNDLESIDEYDFQGQKRWGFFYYDSEYGYCESLGVTHWMPLPKPPKEEKDG